MIVQINAFGTLRDLGVWFEVKIHDRGSKPTRSDPGCEPNYTIGRVYTNFLRPDGGPEEMRGLTDDETEQLMIAAGDAVHEHLQESLL